MRSSGLRWRWRSASGSGSEAWRCPPWATLAATTPTPLLRRRLRPHPRGLGHAPQGVRRREGHERPNAHLRRDQRHDRGGRRHRPHLVPHPGGARRDGQRVVRFLRRHRRPNRRGEGRPAARHRRVQGQPGREGGRQRVGDEIVSVDGNSTTGRHLDEVSGWVRGEAGSKVNVTLRPGATARRATCRSSRADVAVVPVTWAMVPGTHTAMIRLEQFSHGATDAVKAAVTAARAAGADRLVLDLRGNPGGYVNEAEGDREPVPEQRPHLHRARRGRQRDEAPGRRRTASPPICRWSSSSMAARQARPRSCRAPSRTPAEPRSSGPRRSAQGPCLASSRCRTGRRCASGRSNG